MARSSGRTRLTPSGRWASATSVVLLGVAYVTEINEFLICGVFLLCLVVASRWYAGLGGIVATIGRSVAPGRLTVGDLCRVRLAVRPAGRRSLRGVSIRDHFEDAAIDVAPTTTDSSDGSTQVRYDLRTSERGIGSFGPVVMSRSDPLGLAICVRTVADRRDIIVLPKVHRLEPGDSGGSDPLSGARHQRATNSLSEEFDALREYVPGDDVRRVHWASTARLGRPMVRNHQQPWQRRTTVVLDTEVSTYRGAADSFERSVSAAASVLVAGRRAGDVVRLVTSHGADSGIIEDTQQLDAALDALAMAHQRAGGNLTGAMGLLTGLAGDGDRLIVCTGRVDPATLAAMGPGGAGRDRPVLIDCDGVGPPPNDAADASLPILIRYGPADDLAHSWNDLVARTRMPQR